MILGPKPELLRPPATTDAVTYASLQNLDLFSNTLVEVENVVVSPEPPESLVQGSATPPSLPQFPGQPEALLFCIPPNSQLLAYWDTVAQRLYNIRHCLNLQGVAQPLPLYAPPLNPLALVEGQAATAAGAGATTSAPIYRFATYQRKALELTNDVRAFGALILSALEKRDAETLSVLRANQELDIQTRLLDIKQGQVTEAQDQITVLRNQKAVVRLRYNFYKNIAFMNAWETAAITLQGAALIAHGAAIILDMTSGGAHLVPDMTFGVSGFGGSPTAVVKFGGANVGSSTASWATVARGLAGILSESGGMAATMGGYQRRMDEWQLQANMASAEMTQLDSQIAAATDRLNVATNELSLQNERISNAQAVGDFLTGKYTNAQLYNWMASQLSTVYAQAYQLAFALALQAQNAYQYELGAADTFIQPGYWDSQHNGLTAGESLLFDLRRMETRYLDENGRELELTKHVSLALTDPLALVMLRETGSCPIALDEALFERDHPGQYFRRLRAVALTVPCITGPYTGVHATLSLSGAVVRTAAPGNAYTPASAAPGASNDATVVASPPAAAGATTIATSNGQNDAGLFEANLHDERWLPFEGQGAISTWNLTLDPRDNNFDFSTISDVILHVRYTARGGGDQTAAATVRNALVQQFKNVPQTVLVSVRSTFSDAYYRFFHPADQTATAQSLVLPISPAIFPYSNLVGGNLRYPSLVNQSLKLHIHGINMFVFLNGIPQNPLPATFTPPLDSGSTPAPAAIQFNPATDSNGNGLAALNYPASGLAQLIDGTQQPLNVTVQSADLTHALGSGADPATQVEDIVLLISYSLS